MDFRYTITENAAIILQYTGSAEEVAVPERIEDRPVNQIGASAFAWNDRIARVHLPETLRAIGDKAFYNCRALRSVEIPGSVASIGDDAFNFCTNLRAISIPDSVAEIGREAFARCDQLRTVFLGSSLRHLGEGAFYCDDALEAFVVDPDNPTYEARDGVLFERGCAALVQYPNARQGAEYAVPEDVRTIGYGAFAWNQGLQSVTLPDGIESVGNEAFQYAQIRSFTFGKNLRAIGRCAFEHCAQLGDVCFPDLLKYIGEAAFCQCPSMREIRIPDGVISIGAHAFQLCTGVTEVFIGKGTSFIGSRAFSGTSYTKPGNQMQIRRFTVLNRTVPIDVYTFDFNPHIELFGYADNVTLRVRAGSTMTFRAIPCADFQSA